MKFSPRAVRLTTNKELYDCPKCEKHTFTEVMDVDTKEIVMFCTYCGYAEEVQHANE